MARADLPLAPLPEPICTYLADQFGRGTPTFRYGFRFAARLLAASDWAWFREDGLPVPLETRKVLAGVRENSAVASMTKALIDARIIQVVHAPVYTPGVATGRSTHYGLGAMIHDLLASHSGARRFKSASDFDNRRPFRPGPTRDLHRSFKAYSGPPELLEAVVELQGRALTFNADAWQAARSNGTALATSHDVQALAPYGPGANYTTYRLPECGRLQTSGPNFQGVPRHLRRYFQASSPDQVLAAADYSQQAVWILAGLSGDRRLQQHLLRGLDLYQAFGQICGTERSVTKKMVNAFINGGQVRAIASAARNTRHAFGLERAWLDLGRSFMFTWEKEFPASFQWLDSTASAIARSGQASSISGWFTAVIDGKEARTRGISQVILGTSSEMMLTALANLAGQPTTGCLPIFPIYDGIVAETSRASFDLSVQPLARAMEAASLATIGLRIPCEVKVWG